MEEQQNAVAEEEHLCKKCEKRLPKSSYFCMYCGTDNSPTSVQVEYEKANNESLKKYTIIKAQKKTLPWYLLFILLVIDVIVINFILFTNQSNLFVKVNSARFENYEKTYYIAEDVYLAVKDNKIRMIGSNRMDYIDSISEIQQFEFKDIQEVRTITGSKKIYLQSSKNKIYALSGKNLETIETETDYIDIYHYLNDKKSNCYNQAEHIVLSPLTYYFDPEKKEIIYVETSEYINNGTKVCANYVRSTAIDNNELNLENPEVVYHSYDGYDIALKNNKEIVEIKAGKIVKRHTEIKVKEDTIKVEDIKKIFYENNTLTVIDKKDDIYVDSENLSYEEIKDQLVNKNTIKLLFKYMDKDTKIDLIILLVLAIVDLVLLFRMSNKGPFYKVMNTSAALFVEYILFTVFRGDGFELNSGAEFMAFVKLLILVYLLLIIISMIIVQISDIAIKLLDVISFKNIISFIFVFVAILFIFLAVITSGANGLFFAVFLLGSYWSYFTEVEDVDIDLFITPSSYVPIAVLSGLNVILFCVLLHIFKISNYFIFLVLISIMFAIYLAVRPELAKKELTGKSIKSLLVIILSLVYSFIITLFTMDLFNKLVKDDGTIMKFVLTTAFQYVLYLVVTFGLLILISSILRVLHKVIKKICKNTNTVVSYLIFSLISLVLFSIIIYFFPEIVNLINLGVSKVFTTIIK